MSIVGTRPPTLDEWNKYELHHRARLAIKPGIVVSIFSIFLGICAIVQAKRYNQESDKLNADTKKMLSLQLEEIQTIEKKMFNGKEYEIWDMLERKKIKLKPCILFMVKKLFHMYMRNCTWKHSIKILI